MKKLELVKNSNFEDLGEIDFRTNNVHNPFKDDFQQRDSFGRKNDEGVKRKDVDLLNLF